MGAKRVSLTVNYLQAYCLAEVEEDFDPSESEMESNNIDFWYEVTGSQVDASDYKLRKYKGGIIEGVMNQMNLSKERNLAYSIYAIAQLRKSDEWQIWNRSMTH